MSAYSGEGRKTPNCWVHWKGLMSVIGTLSWTLSLSPQLMTETDQVFETLFSNYLELKTMDKVQKPSYYE
jgi:hypothetical protein